MSQNPETQTVRLDKWLWAARFFKTRSLAAEAVSGGKVHVNGARVKPARAIKVGDQVLVRRAPLEWSVVVCLLEKRRGPAIRAALLYEETEESKRQREVLVNELRAQGPQRPSIKGRPSKKDRRALLRLTRGSS